MKRLLLSLLVASTISGQTIEVPPATAAGRQLKSHLDLGADAHVRNVYAPAGYQLLWSRDGRPNAQAQAVIALMKGADAKALDPSRYEVKAADPIQFDVAVTAALARYASDLRIGRVHPTAQFELDADAKQVYLPELVLRASEAADPVALIAALEPQNDEYRQLLAALQTWRRIAAESANDKPLPQVAKLAAGDSYDALPQLAERLRRFGDLDTNVEGTTYDGALYTGSIIDAVKRFQSRHGLDADGVISTRTFAALNVPAAQRVKQIEMSIERWRWTPAKQDGPSIVVNIPEFRLTARNAKGETLEMRVVVGRASRNETPVFEGDLRTVVFRPYWSVPMSIQRGEIAPKLEKDPGYLARNNYEITDGTTSINADTIARIRTGALRIRQKPGPSNALGLVKFFFPNDNNVYLHSTPQQSLFARSRRDFSHGCIRVENPEALAAFILDWSPEKVRAAMNGKRDDNYVRLAESVNVRILYATAVARADGQVHFFDDIYGHDVELAKVLAPRTKTAAAIVAAR